MTFRHIGDSVKGSGKKAEPLTQNGTTARFSVNGSVKKTEPFTLLGRWWVLPGAVLVLAFLLWLFVLPMGLFRDAEYSTVVESAEGELLGARIAADGQWRFPPDYEVPERFAAALMQFEDRHFRWHPGVDIGALARALRDNIRSGHVVSGGSTITMQVIRLSRGGERTLWKKAVEAVEALRLDARTSKRRILAMYAANAPFGGNVVGLDAASWRYFGRPPGELSWAESATLAVLPNSPASIHPGKGRDALLAKRNRLLARLLEHGDIDLETYSQSITEPLPSEPVPLPGYAPHFVEGAPKGVRTRSTLRFQLQKAVEEAVGRRSDALAAEGIADMAAIVVDNRTGEVVAYVGNSSPQRLRPGAQVDIAGAARSTGSILKPFLYADALESGVILPGTLLPDIPVNMGGFAPQNFDRQFYGAVPASDALARSLNVPAVFLLRKYGVERFWEALRARGITTLTHPAGHYGLSLILGGAEASLREVTAAYSAMVTGYTAPSRSGQVALWYTFEALKEVNRPDQLDWRLIGSVRKAAWKTGTSFGFRDAWAVGMTPEYTIGVWAGNAGGAGVPGLTGARAAGPAMFDILNILPESQSWFEEPVKGIVAGVCPRSGYIAGPDCPLAEDMLLPPAALDSEPCPYHSGGEFALPPAMEWYYRPHHPEYGAPKAVHEAVMEFIYPSPGAVLSFPPQISGETPGAVFRLAHRNPGTAIWWHLDGSYVGETTLLHQMRLSPAPGKHILTVVDEDGNSLSVRFSVRI